MIFFFERNYKNIIDELLSNYSDITYLQDSGVEIDGIKFWGSPVTPPFMQWAFMRKPDKIVLHWDAIPDDTDVLITHGPAKGTGDFVYNRWNDSGHRGCDDLLLALHRVNPQFHIYGHVHEGYGKYEIFNTFSYNVSSLNARYKCTNEPVIFEVDVT